MTHLGSVGPHSEYVLVGSDTAGRLPKVDLLGIHYVKVKEDRKDVFERFVRERVNPATVRLFPDMRLLYYGAVHGGEDANYIALFAIESAAARERYWPTGKPQTQALKAGFLTLQRFAAELAPLLVEGSYLESSSGAAAAVFESQRWTDFVHTAAPK